MTSTNLTESHLGSPRLTAWMPGPFDPAESPVVVSVTEYLADRRRDLPGVAVNGLRMGQGWYAMPGAVGLWLWSAVSPARGGSISVWAGEEDLERFINLPHHVDIMTRYGPRGTVRSTKWVAERFEKRAVITRARRWITDASNGHQ